MGTDTSPTKEREKQRVPLHIITGFLGVGKTTAILSLLDRLGKKERIAVLVNEWGEIGLDGDIIASRHPTLAVREVSGGCICCTAGAALVQTTLDVLENLNPNRIIIEPSGVSKPGEIVDCLTSPQLAEQLEVRPVIGLVDPERFLQPEMMKMPIYSNQVEAASILVANRCDQSDPRTITAFLEKAETLYPPKTTLYTTSFGVLPLEALEPFKKEPNKRVSVLPGIPLQPHTGKHTLDKHAQAGWTWPAQTIFNHLKLKYFFNRLVTDSTLLNSGIVRAKGVFHTDRGWFLMELATGKFHQWESQYRGQNRCQLIAQEYSTQKKSLRRLEELGSEINACRSTSESCDDKI